MNTLFHSRQFKAILALTLILLLLAGMIPAQAHAATAKYSVGTINYGADSKTKIGDGYFWYDYNDDYSKCYLYYSAKKSEKAKKVKLATIDQSQYNLNYRILYNGSKVFYSTWNFDANGSNFDDNVKVRIHSVSDTGKNRKTLKTIKVKDQGIYIDLLKVYNNRLYFLRSGDTTYKLCSLNLKTNKVTVHEKEFTMDTLDNNSGSSRYIYGKYFIDGDTIIVFDCKTNKIIRNIDYASRPVAGSSHMIYRVMNWETFGYELYKSSLSGKNPELILELGSNTTVDHYTATKIYYSEYTDQMHYYIFSVKDGSLKEISESEYGEIVGWY